MTRSTLRQVLSIFENAHQPLSLTQIAHELDMPPERLDMMIEHWVRKGKIRESNAGTTCGSCGHQGACPFVMEMPRTYELTTADATSSSGVIMLTCDHHSDD